MIKDYKVPKFLTMRLIAARLNRKLKLILKKIMLKMVKHNDIPNIIYPHERR